MAHNVNLKKLPLFSCCKCDRKFWSLLVSRLARIFLRNVLLGQFPKLLNCAIMNLVWNYGAFYSLQTFIGWVRVPVMLLNLNIVPLKDLLLRQVILYWGELGEPCASLPVGMHDCCLPRSNKLHTEVPLNDYFRSIKSCLLLLETPNFRIRLDILMLHGGHSTTTWTRLSDL